MKYDKYDAGRDICDELFKRTGDPRFHNMRVGFEELKLENEEKKATQSELSEEEMFGRF